MSERVIDVGFVVFLAICVGAVLTVCGLVWLFIGGSCNEDDYAQDELP